MTHPAIRDIIAGLGGAASSLGADITRRQADDRSYKRALDLQRPLTQWGEDENGPGLFQYDPATRAWSRAKMASAMLDLPPVAPKTPGSESPTSHAVEDLVGNGPGRDSHRVSPPIQSSLPGSPDFQRQRDGFVLGNENHLETPVDADASDGQAAVRRLAQPTAPLGGNGIRPFVKPTPNKLTPRNFTVNGKSVAGFADAEGYYYDANQHRVTGAVSPYAGSRGAHASTASPVRTGQLPDGRRAVEQRDPATGTWDVARTTAGDTVFAPTSQTATKGASNHTAGALATLRSQIAETERQIATLSRSVNAGTAPGATRLQREAGTAATARLSALSARRDSLVSVQDRLASQQQHAYGPPPIQTPDHRAIEQARSDAAAKRQRALDLGAPPAEVAAAYQRELAAIAARFGVNEGHEP